jgi:hypothetical protein
VRRFLCSRNPHFRKWSFDGRSRNHLTDPHDMGDGRRGGEVQGIGSSQPSFLRAVGIIPAIPSEMVAGSRATTGVIKAHIHRDPDFQS